MAYIDADYYIAFTGDAQTDPELLLLVLDRSSDIIDIITNYCAMNFSSLNDFEQSQIKKAVAAMAEFALNNDGLEVFSSSATSYGGSVRIGDFSYGDNRLVGDRTPATRIPPLVFDYLRPTGLLYPGVGVV